MCSFKMLWRTPISTDAKETLDRMLTCLSRPVISGFSPLEAEQLGIFTYGPLCKLAKPEILKLSPVKINE